MTRRNQDFQTIRSEGGLLPPDLLRRVLDPKSKLAGTEPGDYGLPPGERLNEAITQSWNRLRKHWADFRSNAKGLPEEESGTGLTNDKWNVPLLRELGFGMLPTGAAPEIDGKTYAIQRFFGATAVHLIGCQLDLDKRAKGVRGAAIANPHGLVQDFLNRSDKHLWAILSNGLQLRILRDSQAISRQSYLEFDLETMFEGEVFADFVLLWLLAHSTRFAAREGDRPETCWLEQWTKEAEEQGTRALGDLRQGVEKALEVLGQGFVSHPKNTALRDALRSGQLTLTEFHGQLLRVVYRLIFLFVAEDRTLDGLPLLHAPDDSGAARTARERYAAHYSAGRLRDMAGSIRGSRHGDLWWQLNLVVGAVSGDVRFKAVREQLALPALGSFLWSPDSTAALNAPSVAVSDGTELANADLLEAIRNLAFTRQNHTLRPVDYKNLGAEELGGVYESLLALTPQISSDGAKFTFAEFAGNERKTSGSYYTPDSLVQCLLDSALEPVIEEAIKGKSGAAAEQAILSLKVCDPAVGSGHFLVGAAHRLARHLARIRAVAQGEGEPSPDFYIHALRDVIGRCLYGVDINPMAAELCRVSLWLEALEPGKPLSFLDHHIRVGNSLLGTTPELIAGGLPDDAFTAIEGDDKKVCAQLKKRNKAEREGFEQKDWIGGGTEHSVTADLSAVTREASKLDATADDTVDAVQRKADQFHRLVVSVEYKHAQQVADAWCAAFVWPKTPATVGEVVTSGAIKRLGTDPKALSATQTQAVERLSAQYQFFHWHLAFPEVFAKGGFDCVLGNPPWERVKLQDVEYFSTRYAELSEATDAAAKRKLLALIEKQHPVLWAEYLEAARRAEAASGFMRGSGLYPLCGSGDVNTYAVFSEIASRLVGVQGAAGLIVPSGIATDNNTRRFFWDLIQSNRLKSLFDFENRKRTLFPSVYYRMRFCALTISGARGAVRPADFVFLALEVEDLADKSKHFALSKADIELMNPDSRTCPMFLSAADADVTLALFRRMPLFGFPATSVDDDWQCQYKRMFDMSADAELFEIALNTYDTSMSQVPLYEGRMFDAFNHRHASMTATTENVHRTGVKLESESSELEDPSFSVTPRHFLATHHLTERISTEWKYQWLLALKDVTSSTNARTVIASILPLVAAGHTSPVLLAKAGPTFAAGLLAVLNSYALDFAARKKVSGNHLTLFVLEQLPIPSPARLRHGAPWARGTVVATWLQVRVLELTYTAWDLEPFAKDCGFDGPPFRWDEDRRFFIRAELDAALFHLYLPSDANGDWVPARKADGCPYDETPEQLMELKKSFPKPRDAVSYIMDTFPIVKRKDEEKWGSYRTKEMILSIYDEMQEAVRTAKEYQTRLDPPPGDPKCCHPPRAAKVH